MSSNDDEHPENVCWNVVRAVCIDDGSSVSYRSLSSAGNLGIASIWYQLVANDACQDLQSVLGWTQK